MKLKRNNLYKKVKMNINEQMTLSTLSGITTVLWGSGTAVFEYQLIQKMIENPKYLLAIPVSLLGLVIGSLATVLSTGVTLDLLKSTKSFINFKKEMINNENDNELSLKLKSLENNITYSWNIKNK